MSWTQVSSGTGPTGAEGPEGPAGGTAGIVLYCDPNDASDLAGYKTALLVPSAAAETPVTVTVTSSGTYVAIGSFATDPGSPASTSMAAGQYAYSFFGTTNSSTNRARLKYELYTCAADGSSETLRRTSTSGTFYSATVQSIDDTFLDQTGYTMAVTDRLVLKVSAARVSGDASFPVDVYFCGNNNASHTHTSAVAKTIAVGIQTTSGPTTLDITTIADGQYLKRSGTNVIGASTSTPAGFMSAIYGPGGMGDLTVATGTTFSLGTASRDGFYQNVTIQGTGQLKTAGYKLHVAGTLTISASGSVNDDGTSATGSTAGSGFTSGSSTRGTSGGGGAGVINAVGNGAAGSLSNATAPNNSNVAPTGGVGGAVGVQTGGAAGSSSGNINAIYGNWVGGRAASAAFNGGSGGGSGGNATASLTSSGGGGAGGGVCWVAAKTIVNSGVIGARGGNGGNAATTSAGNAGGGAGGGGGICFVITDTPTSAVGTISTAGGSGGTGVGTGAAGNAGVAGAFMVVGLGGT